MGISILILAFTIISPNFVQSTYTNVSEFSGDRAWIRLCSGGGGENILGVAAADNCASGFWFKNSLKVSCACGHGVWVFAKGWCDKSAKVVVAYNGSCFSVDKDVRYIRSIGYAKKAYLPFHFQTTSGFEFIQELPINNLQYTYFSNLYDQHLGAIFPNNQIESQNSRRCVEYNATSKSAIAIKYFADKLPYRQTTHCYKPHGQGNTYKYDDFRQINEIFGLREKGKEKSAGTSKGKDDKCAASCIGNGAAIGGGGGGNGTNGTGAPAPPAKTPETSTFIPDYLDPYKDEYLVFEEITIPPPDEEAVVGNATNNATKPANGTSKPIMKMRGVFPLFRNQSVHGCDDSTPIYNLTSKTIREINEQTKRMIMANLGFSFKNIPTPKVEVTDYVFLQLARKILLKVCPSAELPPTLVTSLHRMFRVAVKESLKFYPYEKKSDENRSESILAGLQNCLAGAHPLYFNYQNSTDPEAVCPVEFRDVSYTYTGGKNPNRTLLTDVPAGLKTDLKQLDLPVETAWKTVMFTHYYCARHFAFNVSEYSYFYDKIEMFFNRWIQHRWFYPGLGSKAFEYAFQMYNMTTFAENLDKCVGASRSFSSYRKWLKRPVYVKHCGGASFQSLPNQKPKPGAKKLDPIAPELTQFDKKAYCLPYWHSPVSNLGINYDPTKEGVREGDGCIQYKKEEWEDILTPNVLVNWNNHIQ